MYAGKHLRKQSSHIGLWDLWGATNWTFEMAALEHGVGLSKKQNKTTSLYQC